MGRAQFRKVNAVITVRANVESVEYDRLQVRIARIEAKSGGILQTFDTRESVFEAGKVFWINKSGWKKC